ncbi:MAG: recombinase RecA [Pseudomonadota bacterium]
MENLPNDWSQPEWGNAGRVHEWKNYVSEEVRSMWAGFTEEQKQALVRQADELAGREDWD